MNTLYKIVKLRYARFVRPLRFGLVGASGVVVNTLILWLLTQIGGVTLLVASALATEVAILTNFLLNDRWTFGTGQSREGAFVRFLRFNSVALGGMAITIALLALLTSTMRMPLLMANMIAVCGAMIWNYLINSRWTWRSNPATKQTNSPQH